MDLNVRMDYEACSPTEKEAKKHDGLESIQWMKDKIGRTKGWAVCWSKFNYDDKSIVFERLTGNRETSWTSMERMSYEDICNFFWYKSFEVVDVDTFRPVKMTLAERDAIEKPKIKKSISNAEVIEVDEDKIIDEAEVDDIDAGDQEDVHAD